eukprot:9586379-Prorocentrum_lima.AAC.1
MTSSLVGSEMCIRDSAKSLEQHYKQGHAPRQQTSGPVVRHHLRSVRAETVSYTHLTLPTICSV